MIALPPFDGAVQLTVALALPPVADTAVGAVGSVGPPPPAALSTTVAFSQVVSAAVPALEFGVSPVPTTRSWTSIVASPAGERFSRTVQPEAPVTAPPNPEST